MATEPPTFSIGTQKAFDRGYSFPYTKQTIGGETVYVCTKGSDHARAGEVFVLRSVAGTWTAWDSAMDGPDNLQCRQPMFRSDEDITAPGWHRWSINLNASRAGDGSAANWAGTMQAETRFVGSS